MKTSRTIPLRGKEKNYYHCWYCGFICDVNKNTLGDAQSMGGESFEDFAEYSYRGKITTEGIKQPSVLMKLDSSGNTATIKHSIKLVVSSGCPFCGSYNWRGDY